MVKPVSALDGLGLASKRGVVDLAIIGADKHPHVSRDLVTVLDLDDVTTDEVLGGDFVGNTVTDADDLGGASCT